MVAQRGPAADPRGITPAASGINSVPPRAHSGATFGGTSSRSRKSCPAAVEPVGAKRVGAHVSQELSMRDDLVDGPICAWADAHASLTDGQSRREKFPVPCMA